MLAYIKGILTSVTPLSCTVEVHGMGYNIFIPVNLHAQLPLIGSDLLLYTSLVIRETAHLLYGFISKKEKELFEALTAVSGIGPKLALSLIGHLSIQELQTAISCSDIHAISKVPGVGKRIAERLVVELRNKLPNLFPKDPIGTPSNLPVGKMYLIRDAMSALTNLGYNQAAAQKAIKNSMENLPEDIDLATLITASLKNV